MENELDSQDKELKKKKLLCLRQVVSRFRIISSYKVSGNVAAYHLAAEPILCRRKGTMFDLTAGCKAALFSAYSLKQ